jgi:hypothetical protein
MYLFFNNIQAAREIAYALRGDWDGCNGVVFRDGVESLALQQAIATVGLEIGEEIEFCRLGSRCTWLSLTATSSKIESSWFFDLRSNSGYQRTSTEENIENNPQVESLLAQLEPGALLLNTYEYHLSPEMDEAFWRIAWQGRKYGIKTIKVETREQGLALSHALSQSQVVDLFDYQVQN